jgi:hypothetical protein
MTKEELASLLDGSEYPFQVPGNLLPSAKENGLIVVYGASDDLIEFEGAIHDERGAGDETDVLILEGKLFQDPDCNCFYAQKAAEDAKAKGSVIKALFDKRGYSWIYETNIPHATFEILEDDQKYCRGIVFALADAK